MTTARHLDTNNIIQEHVNICFSNSFKLWRTFHPSCLTRRDWRLNYLDLLLAAWAICSRNWPIYQDVLFDSCTHASAMSDHCWNSNYLKIDYFVSKNWCTLNKYNGQNMVSLIVFIPFLHVAGEQGYDNIIQVLATSPILIPKYKDYFK